MWLLSEQEVGSKTGFLSFSGLTFVERAWEYELYMEVEQTWERELYAEVKTFFCNSQQMR